MRAIYYMVTLCLLVLVQPAFAVDDIYGPGNKDNAGGTSAGRSYMGSGLSDALQPWR